MDKYKKYKSLFDFMKNEHAMTLTISEMDELILECKKVIQNFEDNTRFDSDVFMPPFRLGRKQERAILDANGKEVIIMPYNSEKQAQMYCDYLNWL